MGAKGRPFYRIVVAKSTAGRDGAFVEVIGTYNPLTKPSTVSIKEARALHWLLNGAQPTETVAYLLKKNGVLDQFFAERPNAKAKYKTLDKRTGAMTRESVVQPVATTVAEKPTPAPAPEPAPEPEPVVAEVAESVAVVEEAPVVAETPAVEAMAAEEPTAETENA